MAPRKSNEGGGSASKAKKQQVERPLALPAAAMKKEHMKLFENWWTFGLKTWIPQPCIKS